ncbi:hypothetical protein GUITHDRAFT_152827 [Guillardia theta CCMP2712]|uniref:Uncharacterized protein n=1 Tax=Guillardia theta (strain CCMP2712) TaxID=905079 RepID=L1J9L5_GUITC|nr:hypothetical protein GUITHDRAFT_152827 [Guillardia theta CCMP2712]EKX45022.1 hypothetical protein GUITHDRAFT_152827 [Guillardia theta CCMP2712]|eukprot:XP_005832002.1 hypothetical protein GUITHDRAFT_152827 [Guillardia theta CCMP2712]
MLRSALLLLLALACVSAFAPAALPALRSTRKAPISSVRMAGADRMPPGPKGRGPFGPEDTFVLPDGRSYTPGDACTDDIYGAALANPVVLPDALKLTVGAGLLGFSVLVPTILIKVIGGY